MEFRTLIPWSRGRQSLTHDQAPVALRTHINDLFDDFFGARSRFFPTVSGREAEPRIDVSENEEEFRIQAELPGVEKDDIHITLAGDTLLLRAEKKAEERSERDGQLCSERFFGAFERRLQLPCEVAEEQIEATFTNGVLGVRLPKSREAKARERTIPVKSGA